MNIAIVGGGKRCKKLMEVIERHTFVEIDPKIIAVADRRTDAPGLLKAVEKGLMITTDYNDFFKMDEIELIIELTGNKAVYDDIMKKIKKDVRAISARTAQLFWEINRVSTMMKRSNQELHESRALYRALINELIQEDVLVIAYDYRIMDVNDALLQKLGLEREDVIGKYCYEITHHRDLPCEGDHHPCPLIQTLETEKPSQTTHVHLDRNNREIYYSISTYPLIEDGDVVGAMEISRDITSEIDMQKMMMQQGKMASIGRLAAGVAHEINNPMTTILTSAMLIQEELDPDDSNAAEIQTIVDETLRCRRIVTSLLDFARQTPQEKKEHSINDIIRESILLTQKQAAFKDVRVLHDLGADIPGIFVDKGQIQQALINLILNGVEATPAGGEVKLQTRFFPAAGVVQIKISDTGSGMDEATMDSIFDPFFTTKEKGNGLGLAITHGIIEQHRGSISVSSTPGEATVFTLELPVNGEDSHAD
jgi:two-component system, NtrC family, sensor kinase